MINKLAELHTSGKLNNYIFSQASIVYDRLPVKLQEKLLQEAISLSSIGISSEEDHKKFIYILRHAQHLGEELTGKSMTYEESSKLSSKMYKNTDKFTPNSILNLYSLAEYSLKEIGISIKKFAYPVEENGLLVEPPYNIQKWMASMQSYYVLINRGYSRSYCFGIVTNGWDEMEQKDFKHWMRFYEGNAHNKYKTAQYSTEPKYYQAGEGAMIPLEHLRAKLPGMPDMTQYNGADNNMVIDERQAQQARKIEVEAFIKAIIGRLNAAERLATKPEAQAILQKILNMGLPAWLESLHRLKREIQTAPLRSAIALRGMKIKEISKSATDLLMQDLLFKEANILQAQGKTVSAQVMRKLAQAVNPPPVALDGGLPPAGPPAAPNDMSMPGDNGTKALDEFVKGINNIKDDDNDSNDSNDSNDIEDMDDDALASITVTAQAVPIGSPDIEVEDEVLGNPPSPPGEQKPAIQLDPGAPQKEEKTKSPMPPTQTDQPLPPPQKVDISDPFESALSGVGMVDVIARLEALANIFRNREIARQLAIIDLMMDKLGIASFFPSLAEASSKSLESNQYALTRIEDILSKLRGSIETPLSHKVDLTGPPEQASAPVADTSPDLVKQNLIQNQEDEKAKKERRKQMEEAQEAAPPQITNAPEELAQPVNIQTPSR